MAGDFNATLDHFGGPGVDGGDLGRCRHAASYAGGSIGTWSTEMPALLGARSTTSSRRPGLAGRRVA